MLVKLPWGDYVNDGRVSAITVDRSGDGFVVCVSLREGMEVCGPPTLHDADALKLAEDTVRLLEPLLD